MASERAVTVIIARDASMQSGAVDGVATGFDLAHAALTCLLDVVVG